MTTPFRHRFIRIGIKHLYSVHCTMYIVTNVMYLYLLPPPPPALLHQAGQAEPGRRQAGQYGMKPGSQPSTAARQAVRPVRHYGQAEGRAGRWGWLQSGQYGIAAKQSGLFGGLWPNGSGGVAVLSREAVSVLSVQGRLDLPSCSGVLVQMFPLGLLHYRSCGSFFPHPALLHGREGRVHCASYIYVLYTPLSIFICNIGIREIYHCIRLNVCSFSRILCKNWLWIFHRMCLRESISK